MVPALVLYAMRWTVMNDLDRETRRLGGEIRAVKSMLVESCGLTPVIPEGAALVCLGTQIASFGGTRLPATGLVGGKLRVLRVRP